MDRKLRILVSNDDGVNAPGIAALVGCLRSFGHVTVVAPDGPRSGASAQITTQLPLHLIKMYEDEGYARYRCTGTPVDCVKLALNTLFKEQSPDLVVTGINHGRNDGICVIYSGTLGAAMEGCISGIPALAVSVDDHGEQAEMRYAVQYTTQVIEWMLENPIPPYTLLSLNLPKQAPKGLRVAPQALGKFFNEIVENTNGFGAPVYWLSGKQKKTLDEFDTDLDLLEAGYATLTPIHIDMTDRIFIREMRESSLNGLLLPPIV